MYQSFVKTYPFRTYDSNKTPFSFALAGTRLLVLILLKETDFLILFRELEDSLSEGEWLLENSGEDELLEERFFNCRGGFTMPLGGGVGGFTRDVTSVVDRF